MSFRWKTALCMVCLVSLLFGVGSCALISLSFQTALAREEAAARASYDLLFRTLQMVESVEVWSGPVSYTHLDVYKRQGWGTTLQSSAWPAASASTMMARFRCSQHWAAR